MEKAMNACKWTSYVLVVLAIIGFALPYVDHFLLKNALELPSWFYDYTTIGGFCGAILLHSIYYTWAKKKKKKQSSQEA